jgi:DNA-directed RNA polymerase subunit RPC12/RpoP
MSKTKKSFRSDDFDDEDEVGIVMHSEKHQRYANRIIEQALKSKDIDAFVDPDDIEEIGEIMNEFGEIEEDYVACIECGKVLITEDDFKGSSEFYDESKETAEYICAHCMKNDQDN